jgi:PII-like signaling protein
MQVKVVRIYLSEDSPVLNPIFDYLFEKKVKGATLFRGVKGFGHSRVMREARLMDMHFNLPITIEFCDEPAIVDGVLSHFAAQLEPGRVLTWLADMPNVD